MFNMNGVYEIEPSSAPSSFIPYWIFFTDDYPSIVKMAVASGKKFKAVVAAHIIRLYTLQRIPPDNLKRNEIASRQYIEGLAEPEAERVTEANMLLESQEVRALCQQTFSFLALVARHLVITGHHYFPNSVRLAMKVAEIQGVAPAVAGIFGSEELFGELVLHHSYHVISDNYLRESVSARANVAPRPWFEFVCDAVKIRCPAKPSGATFAFDTLKVIDKIENNVAWRNMPAGSVPELGLFKVELLRHCDSVVAAVSAADLKRALEEAGVHKGRCARLFALHVKLYGEDDTLSRAKSLEKLLTEFPNEKDVGERAYTALRNLAQVDAENILRTL